MIERERRSWSGNGPDAAFRQLTRPGHEVGVHVRLNRVRQDEVVLPGEVDVEVDVTPGIDDTGLTRALACDYV